MLVVLEPDQFGWWSASPLRTPFTIRLRPSFKWAAPKLISKPTGSFRRRRYVNKLLGMHRCESFHRLDFHNHARFHQNVDSKGFAEAKPFIFKRKWHLPRCFETAPLQIAREDRLIHGFKQARTKSRVKLVCGVHNFAGNPVQWKFVQHLCVLRGLRVRTRICP
jgi:hypothetical protein